MGIAKRLLRIFMAKNPESYNYQIALPLLAELAQRFNFWGIQSIILLYSIKYLAMSAKDASLIFGAFTSLTFVVAVTGGLIADRWFGFRNVLLAGIFFTLCGLVILSRQGNALSGLSLLATGMGFFLPNNANFLSSFYRLDNPVRERGFAILYMATNIGALLGPLVYGYLALLKWQYAFDFSIVFTSLWFGLYIVSRFSQKDYTLIQRNKKIKYLLCVSLIIIFSANYCMAHPELIAWLLTISGLSALFVVAKNLLDEKGMERGRFLCILLMLAGALVFFSFAFQIYTTLMILIDHVIKRQIPGWQVPTSVFSSLEPLFVVVLTSLLVKFYRPKKNIIDEAYCAMKLFRGFLLCGLSFGVFSIIALYAHRTGNSVSLIWIVLGNVFLSAGEVCIMPSLISAITALAPNTMKSTIVGVLYFSLAFSGYLSGKIAGLAGTVASGFSAHEYAFFYGKISMTSIIFGLIAFGIYVSQKRSFPVNSITYQ